MKGIIFHEFLEMVDDRFGPEVTERIIAQSEVASGGAYTSVGTYDHSEIVALMASLSVVSGMEVSALTSEFGRYLIGRFYVIYPDYFNEVDDVITFLEQVDGYIHVEVRKLYPDAKLPTISTTRSDDGTFVLNYKSARGMGDLAQGMIEGAIEHFGGKYQCQRENLEMEDKCQNVRFTISNRPQLH